MKIFVFTLHKAGSMFLYQYFRELSKRTRYEYFSINNNEPNEKDFINKSNDFIVCPIRIGYNHFYFLNQNNSINIIHLRNPIDILISSYFSTVFTHPVLDNKFSEKRKKASSLSIDEYVLSEVDKLVFKFNEIKNIKEDNIIFSDYSCMFNNFKFWNKKIIFDIFGENKDLEYFMFNKFKKSFGFWGRLGMIKDKIVAIFLGKHKAHRRDGRDNQAEKYLKPETINILNLKLKDSMDFYKLKK